MLEVSATLPKKLFKEPKPYIFPNYHKCNLDYLSAELMSLGIQDHIFSMDVDGFFDGFL